MKSGQDILGRSANFIRRSITLKIFSIGILILLLLIPATMIKDLIRERQYRRDSVVQEISSKWGASQTITGPYLTIPYKTFFEDEKGKTKSTLNYLHILPTTLEATGTMTPEVRYRSLFEAVLYNIKLS